MHALHFTFGLGAFIAPLIARPFLFVDDSFSETDNNHSISVNLTVGVSESLQDSTWTIKALYPLISGYGILSAFFILFYFIKDYRKTNDSSEKSSIESEENGVKSMNLKFKVLLVGIMSVMFFIYVGMEVAFGTFISVFAVKSDLQFTRPQGNNKSYGLDTTLH